MCPPLPEIAIVWEPSHTQSTVFFQVPSGQTRQAEFSVYSRVGANTPIHVILPQVQWLRFVNEPPPVQTPPFQSIIEVDTGNLPGGRQYSADMLFRASNEIIWREPIRLTVAPTAIVSAGKSDEMKASSSPEGWIIALALAGAVILIFFALSVVFG